MAAIYQAYPSGALCGYVEQLTQGKLLSPTPIMPHDTFCGVEQNAVKAAGLDMNDSKSLSATWFFSRGAKPDSGYNCNLLEINNTYVGGDDVSPVFVIYMDGSGFMQVEGRNSSGTLILGIEITNNGGSWAGKSTVTGMAMVVNLDNPNRRALWIDGVDRTNDTNYVSWNTYTDDFLCLDDPVEGQDRVDYYFGTGFKTTSVDDGPHNWSKSSPNYNGDGTNNQNKPKTDAFGFVSLDNDCTLVPEGIWDSNGWVRDPQKWEGWYLVQPKVFFGPTLWRNTGEFEPATYDENQMELIMLRDVGSPALDDLQYAVDVSADTFNDSTIVNAGVPTDLEPT